MPDKTTFYSHPDDSQQVGHIVYKAGSSIPRHVHKTISRTIEKTTEVLYVQKGRCVCRFHEANGAISLSVELSEGDLLCILDGAHSFEFFDDTVMLEVKQGPYAGKDEKSILS